LRSIVPDGVLPQLRSLTVDLRTSCHAEAITREGSRWVETKEGVVTEMDEDYADRWFDHNYLMTLSKAAPHLQELHLSGTSSDHIGNLTSGLSLFHRLETLVISACSTIDHRAFFLSSSLWSSRFHSCRNRNRYHGRCSTLLYAPRSFREAAQDLAEGCQSLQTVRIQARVGYRGGLTDDAVRVVHYDGCVLLFTKRTSGVMIIGREEEW